MKLLSWNVNGVRAVLKKGFLDFLEKEKPDVLALQETKIDGTALGKKEFDFPGYAEFWNPAQRRGYSGTSILVKESFRCPTPKALGVGHLKVVNGFGQKEFDAEGRAQTLELPQFYFVNAYFPNANHELSRLDYKLRFDGVILKYLKKLEKKKPVVICGDFNVAREEIDLARPKDNAGSAGFTDEERAWARELIKAGFIDTFRHFYQQKIQYSWWSYRFNARAKNIGWRIDYFFISAKMLKFIKKAYILNQITGSDHCPVGLEIKD